MINISELSNDYLKEVLEDYEALDRLALIASLRRCENVFFPTLEDFEAWCKYESEQRHLIGIKLEILQALFLDEVVETFKLVKISNWLGNRLSKIFKAEG